MLADIGAEAGRWQAGARERPIESVYPEEEVRFVSVARPSDNGFPFCVRYSL